MDDHILWNLLFQLILISLNAMFACAEIAVLSTSDAKIDKLASMGSKKAKKLSRLKSAPAKFLATIQVAITLSGFLGSAFAADSFSGYITNAIMSLGLGVSEAAVDKVAVIAVTLILSYFTLVFGELVPKRVAMKNAEKLALGMASVIAFLSKIFAPLVWLLTVSTNGILRLFGIDPNADDADVTEEEILMMVDAGSENGSIDEDEKEIIQNVFEFNDIPVGEIATHRTEIDFLYMEDSFEEWEKMIRESRHSVLPVCGETFDDVICTLNVRDYLKLKDASNRKKVLKEVGRDPYFISEDARADVIFRQMQESHNHFAVVLDEYGGTVGILTMNDLLEQLVGELEDDDEFKEPDEIEQIDEGTWKIVGSATLDDVAQATGADLSKYEDYDSFGGLVFGSLAKIPDDGEVFDIHLPPLDIKVETIKDHKIESATVTLTNEKTEDPD